MNSEASLRTVENGIVPLLKEDQRSDITVGKYLHCIHQSMFRFSLVINSAQPQYRDLARRLLPHRDANFRKEYESNPLTAGDRLFTIRWETAGRPKLIPEDYNQHFYGRFDFDRPRQGPRRLHCTRVFTYGFVVVNYEELQKPAYAPTDLGRSGEDDAKFLANCAINYLVKNCFHNFVHVQLQGVNSANFHNFAGLARRSVDMLADNLANSLLVRAYGLPLAATGFEDVSEPIRVLFRRNQCNRMFAKRAEARCESETAAAKEERYCRTLSNELSMRLIARGYAPATLSVYLGSRSLQRPDKVYKLRNKQVLVGVNGYWIATAEAARFTYSDLNDQRRHYRDIADPVVEAYRQKLKRDGAFRQFAVTALQSTLRVFGVEPNLNPVGQVD